MSTEMKRRVAIAQYNARRKDGPMPRALFVALVALLFPSLAVPSVAATAPTFARDVAPILYNSCISCHRPGEVAPMSLVSYQDVRPWAKSIRSKVATRQM